VTWRALVGDGVRRGRREVVFDEVERG